MDHISRRLDAIEEVLVKVEKRLGRKRPPNRIYTADDVAAILDKSSWTVRQWCRQGRIRAERRNTKRGKGREWIVTEEELCRYEREGLLPPVESN